MRNIEITCTHNYNEAGKCGAGVQNSDIFLLNAVSRHNSMTNDDIERIAALPGLPLCF